MIESKMKTEKESEEETKGGVGRGGGSRGGRCRRIKDQGRCREIKVIRVQRRKEEKEEGNKYEETE